MTSAVALVLLLVNFYLDWRARSRERQDTIVAVEQQYRTASAAALPAVADEVVRLQKRYPGNLQLAALRGLIHARQHEHRKAERVFLGILEAQPDNQQALLGLGAVLVALERPADAVPRLQRVVGLMDEEERLVLVEERQNALLHLALAFAGSGRLDEAQATLVELGRPPFTPDAVTHTLLGHVYRMQRNYLQAGEEYRAALDLAPGDESLVRAYVRSLADAGRLAEEVARLEELVAADVTQLRAAAVGRVLVLAYRQLGRDEAAADLARSLGE